MTDAGAFGIAGGLPDSRFALRLGVRVVLTCVMVCTALFLAQRPLTALLLPFYEIIIDLLQQDFSARLQWVEYKSQAAIQMTPFLLRAVPIGDHLALKPFVSLPPTIVSVDHSLVPLVLLFTAVVSWPFAGRREAAVRLALAIAVAPPILALSTPVLLVGGQQLAFFEAALSRGAAFEAPALATLMVFMESGGRWLLPLTACAACIAVSHRLCAEPDSVSPIHGEAHTSSATGLAFPPV